MIEQKKHRFGDQGPRSEIKVDHGKALAIGKHEKREYPHSTPNGEKISEAKKAPEVFRRVSKDETGSLSFSDVAEKRESAPEGDETPKQESAPEGDSDSEPAPTGEVASPEAAGEVVSQNPGDGSSKKRR